MKFKASQIAEILNGTVEGDPEAEVDKLAKIEEGSKGSLTFLSNPKYTSYIYTTNASITIVKDTFKIEQPINTTLIRVGDPYKAFSTLLEYYNQVKLNKSGIENPHFVDDTAQLGENIYLGAFSYVGKNVKIGDDVKIYPNCYIGDNVTIGNNTVIFAGVRIYSETIIGRECIIHGGVVIGADGFGFSPDETGKYSKVPQIGNVIIEDSVDIGAGTTIDRATLGSTFIRKGVKIDNQVQIAHNVEVGQNTAIAAQTGIAGSTKIGQNCLIGGQVGIAGHLTIGNRVKIQAQSGIGRNINDDEAIQGSPSFGYSDFNKSYVHFKNLPKIVDRLNKLEKKQENG
ncbi:UDP-3-O-(3-hydroxymyristoyl)glucosamine N-acyltransferase [Antarcticibacterium sp. 1MA-6-2]|uniref:UDP-3-O-(3-hydroxymyristoyl)glucosamine N-acyltransferase n=1 Tax=Antarcticibacterium sp. 1MA-6-2 TaxID=2908210 RepID=UPI001F4803CE|nr:UDP-3-O-(3-hydroxymyristoyl)glucosamine N-acyltransferase [Antarcticibacterium sp. 1MA-6-2]UJH91544.1 UDP-3-O-(3-hydroxymyristoyl)glucosamine N-acyltransferase [Antarcticibacterium sp. 1MA-6-2]